MTSKMVDYNSWDSSYRSDEQHGEGYSLDIEDTLRSLKEEIKSCEEDNDQIIQSQLLFRACHTYKGMDHLEFVMDRG